MLRKNPDLLVSVLVAAASVAVIRFLPSVALRTAFALPLLFVLPGLTLSAALFPDGYLDLGRRLLLQVGLSLSVGVLGALVLDVTFGLHRFSWAVLLGAVTGVGAAVAAVRRIGLVALGPGLRLRLPTRFEVVLVGIALAVVAGSVVFARTPLAARSVQGYTALSILPVHGHTRTLRLEVASGELQIVSYRLKLHVGPRLIAAPRLTLAPGSMWRETVRVPTEHTNRTRWITARLYRIGHPYGAYRSVRIRFR